MARAAAAVAAAVAAAAAAAAAMDANGNNNKVGLIGLPIFFLFLYSLKGGRAKRPRNCCFYEKYRGGASGLRK